MKLKRINIVTLQKGITGETILDVYSSFSGKRMVVVCVRISSTLLNQQLQARGIDTSQFFFIDCIQKLKEESKQVVCVQSPAALTEIAICLRKVVLLAKPDMIVFDTLSNFLSYTKDISILRFTHDITSIVRNVNSKLIIIMEQKDLDNKLSSVSMLSDTIIDVNQSKK